MHITFYEKHRKTSPHNNSFANLLGETFTNIKLC